MSYDSDFENIYMVEFESGRTIYTGQFTVEDVIEFCADEHKGQAIKSIYKEVYTGENDED
jgi:hypothetical protein